MSRLPALRASRDFKRVYDAGRRARRDGVTVFAAQAETAGRTGIVVPKRVGGAVERNRVKRRIRAILAASDLDGRTDVVVQAGRSVREARFQELEKHLVEALHAAGALR